MSKVFLKKLTAFLSVFHTSSGVAESTALSQASNGRVVRGPDDLIDPDFPSDLAQATLVLPVGREVGSLCARHGEDGERHFFGIDGQTVGSTTSLAIIPSRSAQESHNREGGKLYARIVACARVATGIIGGLRGARNESIATPCSSF